MKNFLIFAVGATVGAVASYFITKNKISKQNESEITELRTMYDDRIKKIQEKADMADIFRAQYNKKEEILRDLEKQVAKTEKKEEKVVVKDNDHFVDYSAISSKKKSEEKPLDRVRIITDSEANAYTKNKGYDLIGFSLYSDDVLIDDGTDNIIEDYEPWVGATSLSDIRENGDSEGGIYILNEDRMAVIDITVMNERFGDGDESGESE